VFGGPGDYSDGMNRFHRKGLLVVVLAVVLVAPAVGAGELFVPVVAQAGGSDGSYWNTELWISNLSGSRATYAITFLPSGTDNTPYLVMPPEEKTLEAGETVHLNGVVPPGNVGALRVFTSSDEVVVRCRLFNARGRATSGQLVPALTVDEMVPGGTTAVLLPIIRKGQFRTNLGFFNPSPRPVRVNLEVQDARGETVAEVSYTVEPGSHMQVNDFLLTLKIRRAEAHRVVFNATGPVAGYASFVDTRAGAATFVSPTILR